MSNLLSCTAERVYFKDLQSRFLLVSAGWIAAYAPDHTAAELIGKTDFDFFGQEHASAAFEDEQQIIRTGEPIIGKLEQETGGGLVDAWASSTKMPLRDESGRIIGTFGISRDVTAQIKAEKALEQVAEAQRLAHEFKPQKASAPGVSPSSATNAAPLRSSSGVGQAATANTASAPAAASRTGVVNISAADDSYEIFVDGAFVGNTPAKVKLTEGAHLVEVKRAGFKDYRKQIKITDGSELTLRAVLEKP